MKNRNDELHNIFKGIANKNEKEFDKLYNNYKSLIYAVVFSMLKNKEDSEEVVQIIFTKIWDMKASNLPTEKETTWLHNVTKNTAIDYLRKQKSTLNIDELYYINVQDEELDNIIEKEYYNKILASLNIKEQEIVSLKILSNLSFKEISKILDIPIGTVQWKYYKSLNTLKMLISNLTMFILTFTLYIKQRNSIRKIINKNEKNIEQNTNGQNDGKEENKIEQYDREGNKIEQSQETNDTNQKQESEIKDREPIYREELENKISNDNELKSNNTNNETSENNELKSNNMTNETADNSQFKNNNVINETIENTNEIIENTIIKKKQQNNILFYISIIFLAITIVFSIIWVKQKQRKNTKYHIK